MRTTASAPAASAARMTVPAFPGSCTRHSTAARRASSRTASTVCGCGIRATATMSCPVTASAMAVSTSSLASRTRTRSPPGVGRSRTRATSSASAGSRSTRPTDTYTWASTCPARHCPAAAAGPSPRWARNASRQACGPSTRNVPVRRRAERPARAATARTRSARGWVIGSACGVMGSFWSGLGCGCADADGAGPRWRTRPVGGGAHAWGVVVGPSGPRSRLSGRRRGRSRPRAAPRGRSSPARRRSRRRRRRSRPACGGPPRRRPA